MNRDYVLACFLHEHTIFKDKIGYEFEALIGDKVTVISKEHGSEIYLDRVILHIHVFLHSLSLLLTCTLVL